MIKRNRSLILLFGLLLATSTVAQEKQSNDVKGDNTDSSAKQNITKPVNTDNPPPDQIVETKKTQAVDKSGNIQNVTTIEFF